MLEMQQQQVQLRSQIREEKDQHLVDFTSLNTLSEQNHNLKQYIQLNEEEQQELQRQLEVSRKQLETQGHQMQLLKDQLEWKEKQKQQLGQQLAMKETVIHELEEEMNSLQEAVREPFTELEKSIEEEVYQSLGEGRKILSVDMPPGLKELEIRRISSVSSELSEGEKPKTKVKVPDPYYCHFLLLTQAIKIKLNKDDYYYMSVKPMYSEILEKKIPMHEWDDWIRGKFHELDQQ